MKKKFITEHLLKKYPSKTIAGKKIYFKSKKNLPPLKTIKTIGKEILEKKN